MTMRNGSVSVLHREVALAVEADRPGVLTLEVLDLLELVDVHDVGRHELARSLVAVALDVGHPRTDGQHERCVAGDVDRLTAR